MPSTSLHDIKTLVRSMHPLVVIETVEEERVDALLAAVARDLELPLFTWTITTGLAREGATTLPIHGTADPLVLLKHLRSLTVRGIFHLKDIGAHLSTPAVVRACREATQAFGRTRSTAVLSGHDLSLPPELADRAVPVRLELPGRQELAGMLQRLSRSLRQTHRITVALSAEERERLVDALAGLTLNQARQAIARAALDDGALDATDIARLRRHKADAIQDGGLLEFRPLEDNQFELGGFGRLRAWLSRAKIGFGPEARALNLAPPRGVLIVGVQGCGKSLAAKVIAREWQMPLLKLDAARLFDKYIGETEKNLRRALDLAQSLAPVVLWIDEIEKGFAPAGGEGDGGVSRRLLGSFLTWMQERREGVFVAATANDLSALPPELLRKGRFDEIFFVDLPDAPERDAIFRIHLALRRQEPATHDLGALVAASEGFSGAEIEQAVTSALYRALHRDVPLTTPVLLEELAETVPLSVSRAEDLARLRASAAGRFVPVR
ncbi:MAG: AAA family ATPase [Vicinamibacterales bacterium]|nr:AAA family ATPase [Vicinamibacterales bacterium]